ncbi:CdaR family transcriptional regulator [Streptomyces sp. Ag109_O5-10]|uniref:PucR family transcriptional regulator n=1 Tax=Streptomyces sp. Ag109_O5-10 TaxID=1855349 RepID=UPI000896401F|nr:helix-turn-helix domain-containing protein [Streptomyces sp. Ag109_O5-10]SEE97287.1 PucR C-terminal helix-turn-helix domain-containing protein [Streptomyces sp. Ag109_O5-10]
MYATPRADACSAAAGRLRGVLRRLDPDLMAHQLARGLAEVPTGRIPGPGCRAGSREDLIRRSVELIRNWLLSGQEPAGDALSELYEAARAAARHGLLAEDAFRACSGAARAVCSALLELSPAEDRVWLMPQLDVAWAFLDIALTTVRRAFADQRELPSADGNSRAAALFARICARSATTVEDLDRAERLGFDLAGPYCPFVTALDGGSAAAHAGLAARLRSAGALACAEGHRVAGLTRPGFDWTDFLADSALVLAAEPATGRAALAETVGTLHDLVTLGSRAGRRGRIRLDDFLTEVMLGNSPQLADGVMRRVLGRLDAEDPSGTLSRTLACLVAHGFNRTAAAAALPAHRNTLLYRINRIEKLSGLDLDRHAHRELARLAVVRAETTGTRTAPRSA